MKLFSFFKAKKIEERAVGSSSNLITPGQWLINLFGGDVTNPKVDAATSIGITAVWASINLIANTFASLPFAIKRRDENGDTFDIGHPVSNLLKYEPSNLQNAFTFKHSAMVSVLNHGNFYAYIVKDARENPSELIPLSAPDTDVLRQGNEIFYRIWVGEERVVVKSGEIMHIMGLSLNGFEGVSVLKYHKETLGEGIATRDYSRNNVTKGTNVKGVIEFPNKLSKEQMDKLRDSWMDTHAGPNGKDTAILDAGAKFVPISLTPDQIQLISQRKFQISDIARIYGVPPHKIGDLERSTNNNIEHQSIEFVQDTMLPWVSRWEIEIRKKLLRETEKQSTFPKFNLNAIMRGDSAARANFYRTMAEIGALSPDEIRQFEDMNMIEGGDVHTIQMNRIPIKQINEYYENQIKNGSNQGNPVPN